MVQVAIKQDFSETVAYNLPQFPVYIRKGLLSTYPNYRAVSHWHEDIEFIYILSGEMSYDVNGNIIPLRKGEGIIVNSRNFHYGFSDTQTECEFICILIHPTLFSTNTYIHEQFVVPFTECTNLPYIFLTDLQWHRDISLQLMALLELDIHAELLCLDCQRIILTLFETLYTHSKEKILLEQKGTNQNLIQLRKMVHFIQEHYAESLTLESISKVGEMGKTNCCAVFKTYLHTTPVDYLLAYRMSRSRNLLLETDLSITEIAYAVGFHDCSYYTKYFRNYYGKTPREVRKGL